MLSRAQKERPRGTSTPLLEGVPIQRQLQLALVCAVAHCAVYDFEALGAIPGSSNTTTLDRNAVLLNRTLQTTLLPGDELLFPNKTFHLQGGVTCSGLRNITLRFDGTLKFANERKAWPKNPKGGVMNCLEFEDAEDLTLTSSGTGVLDGNGKAWWGAAQYAIHAEDRPKLLQVTDAARVVVEHLHFLNSPYWTTEFKDITDVVIRYCDVAVRWNADADDHSGLELTAFNTDGFDLSGKWRSCVTAALHTKAHPTPTHPGSNVHIHDCNIWNQDDCVCVKDVAPSGKRASCSENWLVERVNASGLGLTVGSIGGSAEPGGMCVRNITFKDSTMHSTVKGLYLKARWLQDGERATIEDVLYENISIHRPEQWAIWVGPAQQADSSHVCSLAWPAASPEAKCPISPLVTWRNITMRDIRIIEPKESPGVVIGAQDNPMQALVFDGVVVTGGGDKPWGSGGYACHGVDNASVAIGGTAPVPPCFNGGKQCHADGECMEKSDMPCCSGKSHATLNCGVQPRCGDK